MNRISEWNQGEKHRQVTVFDRMEKVEKFRETVVRRSDYQWELEVE